MRACDGCGRVIPFGRAHCPDCTGDDTPTRRRIGGRAPSVCSTPGCPKIRPCPIHDVAKPAPRSERYKPYNGTRWRKLSATYRKRHPICEECHVLPSAHVDHKDGRGPDGPRGYDWDNLKALCRSCHSRKTASHDGGFGNPTRKAAA